MGKKKFIDKKKSATFQLLARDSSDPVYTEDPENDRVFVRVDNNPVTIGGIGDDGENYDECSNDYDSIYADAPGDVDYDGGESGRSSALPDHIRKEILELGFPDDGYNYLTHLREIRNTGGGSQFYDNPKANFDLPNDVKAYDASRVQVREAVDDTSPQILYNVAEKTVNVRVQRVVDPDIDALLKESDSDFGSDVEDLEEDFVVQANIGDEAGEGSSAVEPLKNLSSYSEPQEKEEYCEPQAVTLHKVHDEVACDLNLETDDGFDGKPRVQRLLDQQFDLLEHQEYGTDSDDDYDDLLADEDARLAEKLSNALKDRDIDEIDLDGGYKAPADILHEKGKVKNEKAVSFAADILQRVVEYAEKYENSDEDDRVVFEKESSDESEMWDCDTIVSTYSNLDNHPGRIGVPEISRKKKLSKAVSEALKSGSDNIISLGGKQKLPLDYLPQGKKPTKEKSKVVVKDEEQPKRKPIGQETKEEKKERKAAVKEERREARRLKKEIKGLYLDEAKRAQRVAAVSGPSSIHLT